MGRKGARLPGGSWPFILVLYAHGVLAIMSVAMLAPLAGKLARTFPQAPAALLGMVMSAPFVAGALLAAVGAGWVGRWGAHLGLRLGTMAILGADAACLAPLPLGMLLVARLAQGIGVMLVLNAVPVWIIAGTRPERRAQALAVWSTFTSAAWILGPLLAIPYLGDAGGGAWRGVFAAHGLIAIAALLAGLWLPVAQSPAMQTDAVADRPSGAIETVTLAPRLALALAMGGMVLSGVGVNIMLPFLAGTRMGWTATQAAGLVSLLTVLCLLAGIAMGRMLAITASPRRWLGPLVAVGVAALGASFLLKPAAPLLLAALAAWSAVQGAGLALVMAQIPVIARDRADRSKLAGMINQAASLGGLVAPPLFLMVQAPGGLTAVGSLAVACWLIAVIAVCRGQGAGISPVQAPTPT
ncbi:MFS transporter [Novosphingobium pokkalii]|uniref:MFS transporter n=1 Tax=Novosphingobium pokkalii TaxID=1770194 RepID=A0ABV7V306_9SPHN|nr:MFS transporter [Novosphingobium pokkalii]GHC83802.1 hypothetical protein GCM10019060_03550 [Novosphingobium pokkalii]